MDDSIGSLFNQTIGFENIQIILVNDGSTDNSEDICLKFKNLYRENIIYLKIGHSGVSKARNEGLKYANGSYINFLDSDDMWDSQAFNYINLFFNKNKNVDIVAGRIKNFELNTRFPSTDYKFKVTRVVNLIEDFNYIQNSAASCFFRKSSINNKRFDEELIFAEDVKFLNTLFLNKPLLGVVREAVYKCRKRIDSSSASQSIEKKSDFYFKSIKLVLKFLIRRSLYLYNYILPFIQYYIATEILYRLEVKSYLYLDSAKFIKYSKILEKILRKIEDKYILEIKCYHPYFVIYALSKKYQTDKRYEIELKNNSLYYSNYEIINLRRHRNLIFWRFLNVKNNILHLEGEDIFWLPKEKYSYFCQFENNTYYPYYKNYSNYYLNTMYGTIFKGRIICYDIPLKISNDLNNEKNLRFYISYKNNIIEIYPFFSQTTHIPQVNNSYYIIDNYIIKYFNNNLIIYSYSQNLSNSFEEIYLLELKKRKKNEVIKLRLIIKKYNNSGKNTQIWLINDRKNHAGDNGEYFFRYLNSIRPKGIQFYYIIEENNEDAERLKIYKNIVYYNSSEYLTLFLKSDKIISSIADSWVSNPFGNDGNLLCDLFHFDFIYLNNGIIKDDLSKYLNKILKNFQFLVTSSKKEYESILNLNYGYTKENLFLTGIPRFDHLKKLGIKMKKEKIILIFPTWRSYIKGILDINTFESITYEKFIYTDFYKFYNQLINNQLLLYEMYRHNYTGIFCLHQNFAQQYKFFNHNKLFKVSSTCFNQEILVKSSILITDYSSIFFDFGYLKKPIIYSHFDIVDYRKYQFPKANFDYENDGFGPVCYDLECTIKNIIEEIKNNCQLKDIYFKRINEYFEFFDDKNNLRIYKNIIKHSALKSSYNLFQYLLIFSFLLVLTKLINKIYLFLI